MAKFQVDPKVQAGILFGVGALTFLGSTALPAEVPANVAKSIHDWSVWGGQFYLTVVAPLLALYSNSNPGPLAPPDSPAVKAVIAQETKS